MPVPKLAMRCRMRITKNALMQTMRREMAPIKLRQISGLKNCVENGPGNWDAPNKRDERQKKVGGNLNDHCYSAAL